MNQLALEDAVGERRHDPQADRPVGILVQHELVTHRKMKRIGQRRGIGNRRDHPILELPVEQQPGVRGFLLDGLHGLTERETSFRDKRAGRCQNPRILRLVQV